MEQVVGNVVGNLFSRLWDCCDHNITHLCELKRNLRDLESSLKRLQNRRDDVLVRITREESNPIEPAKSTHEVRGWLQNVEAKEHEVENILLNEATIDNGRRTYFCCFLRRNCYSCYKLGNSVFKMLNEVEKLFSEGNFHQVTNRCQPDPIQEIPVVEVVGMVPILDKVLNLLVTEGNLIRLIGLYGMGGVGKTTLLKKVNNELCKRQHGFSLVIWVVVSKDLNLNNIQSQIGKSLGLSWPDETSIHDRACDIFEVLKKIRFLLLVDDIWDRVDLETIGIPNLGNNTLEEITKSKVVFTTRKDSVCGLMEADEKIKVECLDHDEAWELFMKKTGHTSLNCHPDVHEIAKQVARKCFGLPLALITVGRAMASKTTLQEWQHALNVLQESPSEFSGMVDRVLLILKFSYENLQNQKLKSCFLYFSLYPEDYSVEIEDLINLWICEGFLDAVDDVPRAHIECYDVIGTLKEACLLEGGDLVLDCLVFQNGLPLETHVKMHDVVRDLAIWIASDLGEKKNKYLKVHAQDTLKLHKWENAEKISLVGNKAVKELIGAPNCLNLTTLLLERSNVSTISDDFFQLMPKLKVLTMFLVNIKKLPTSIASLTELQYFDFSWPHDTGVVLRPGTISCLTKLKILDLSDSSLCNWEVEGGPSLDELESLEHLIYLGIKIGNGMALARLVSSQKLQLCTKVLCIKYCPGIKSLTFSPSLLQSTPLSSVSLANMATLRVLTLADCDELTELKIISSVIMEDKYGLSTNLVFLSFEHVPNLKVLWDIPQRSSFSFVNLRYMNIFKCPELKDVTWLIFAPNLEILSLRELDGLEEVICDGFATEVRLLNAFSRLKYLEMEELRNLKRICSHKMKFLHLANIGVSRCLHLKKLPFDTHSLIPGTLKMITGEREWWESLEWDDQVTKSNFAPYFVDLN